MSRSFDRFSRRVEIAPTTGPLTLLEGCDALVLCDMENMRYSAQDLGRKFSSRTFRERVMSAANSAQFHAFFTRRPGDDGLARAFEERGWVSHPLDIETVETWRGTERRANSDNYILFYAGLLVSRSKADTIVIATGDGNLGCDLGRFLKELPKPRRIVTASLAGSTSYRLNAERNPFIAANIEIGEDCLHVVEARREFRRNCVRPPFPAMRAAEPAPRMPT